MRAILRLVGGVALLWGALAPAAQPVREYLDPETGALVFDASGENTDFQVPAEPREFRDVPEYLKWVQERFHGRPVFGKSGDLIDVQGSYILLGQPTYTFEGKIFVVSQPVLQTISGPFGFVVIGGEKYEMPLDAQAPPFEEIEPALYSLITWRRSCGLFTPNYCVVTSAFKHIYLFYQSIGGTVNLAASAIATSTTSVSLKVTFRNALSFPIPASTPTTTMGVATISAKGVGGLGIAEWGIFGNLFVDPTKLLQVDGSAKVPMAGGGSGNADASMFQRYP